MDIYFLFKFMLLTVIPLAAFACFDRCDPSKDDFKCDSNRLMHCGDELNRWEEIENCDDYSATCQEGRYVIWASIGWEASHGCALDSIACDGDTDYHCTPNQQLIAVCSYTNEPAAMLIEQNQENKPFCVEKSDGTAAFAVLQDECTTGESMCADNPEHAYICEYGVWAVNQTNFCDFERQNYACVDDTDSNGNADASCEFADPCDESTGVYKICRDESSTFNCVFNDEGCAWIWQASTCYSGVCEVQDDGTGKCQ